MRAAENDFEGIWTTIPWVRDAKGQGGDWGVLCGCIQDVARIPASASMRGARAGRRLPVESTVCRRWVAQEARRTHRTPTTSGVDSVKTVGSARGVKTAGRARGVKTVGRVSGDGMSSLIGLSSFADAAHAQAADDQWSRRCEDAPVATERAV